MHLCDAVETAILLVQAPSDDVVPLVDECEWEGAYPMHYLASVAARAILHNIDLRYHRVLQQGCSNFIHSAMAPL